MSLEAVFKKLNFQCFLLSRLACFTIALVPLAQGVWAEFISPKEKEHVIKELGECLESQVAYMNKVPKYRGKELKVDSFKQAWEYAKIYPEFSESPLGIAARTNDREEFMENVNSFFSLMFSHPVLANAREDIAEALNKYREQLGIDYREDDQKLSNQEYVVQYVSNEGLAGQVGIARGDRFRLCGPVDRALKYTPFSEDSILETLTLNFYRGGRYLRDLEVLGSLEKMGNNMYQFEPDRDNLDTLIEQCLSDSGSTLSLKVGSFSEEGYPGSSVEEMFQCVNICNIQNLIIDLRGNSGGNMLALNHLLSFFIRAEETYAVSITRDAWRGFCIENSLGETGGDSILSRDSANTLSFKEVVSYFEKNQRELCRYVPLNETTEGRQVFTGNVALLIDKNTTAEGELFTEVLKSFLGDRCKVIGQKSSGTSLTIYACRYAGSFKIVYPNQVCLSTSGLHIEGQKVAPDIEVTNITATEESDEAIDVALAWFNTSPAMSLDVMEPYSTAVGGALLPQLGALGHRSSPIPLVRPSCSTPLARPLFPIPLVRPDVKKDREVCEGMVIDSYWIAFVNPPALGSGKVRVGGRVYSVDKRIAKRFREDGASVVLIRVSTPISEISKDYNYRYGTENIRETSDSSDVSGDYLDVIGASKEDQERLYSKNIRTWMDSIVLKDACSL